MDFFKNLIAKILGLLPPSMVALRHIFAALGELFDKLGQDKAAAVTQQAEELAKWVEANHQQTMQWFQTIYPDLQTLLQYWSRLPDFLYVVSNVQKSQQVDLHTAITAAQLGANDVKFPQ